MKTLKWKLFLYIYLTNFNFSINHISREMCFPKGIFYDKTINFPINVVLILKDKFIRKDKVCVYSEQTTNIIHINNIIVW